MSSFASVFFGIKYQAAHLNIKRCYNVQTNYQSFKSNKGCAVLLGPPLEPENKLALEKAHNTLRLKLETPLGQISPSIMPKHNVSLSGKTLKETMQLDFHPPPTLEKSLGQQQHS